MGCRMRLAFVALLSVGVPLASAAADDVVAMNTKAFDDALKQHKHMLVEFYAPWCGHCKKLAPEYEKAAADLKGKVLLVKVDATEEKELSTRYNVKGYPTLIWFQDGVQAEYDGGRTAETIVEWCTSMTGPAVIESQSPPDASVERPRMVLTAPAMTPAFEAAAKANRRKATWYFTQGSGPAKVVLAHHGEDPIEVPGGGSDQKELETFIADHQLPMFGKLDGDTFDRYQEAGKGIVWSLFEAEDGKVETIDRKYRPMMTEIAKKFKGKYFVTYTDTEKFKDALDSMLGITDFPAIAVQKKAGDKKKYIHRGDMTSSAITRFLEDIEAGRIEPTLKSEPVPVTNNEPVRIVVGTTLKEEVFTPNKDVLIEVVAPWCGHCKKLEPDYLKLAKKLQKEELGDLLVIAKIDGTANDSPVEAMEWTGFPTIYFVKAGSSEPMTYEGERTAKGLWKYIKRHSTHSEEIKRRIEARKSKTDKFQEL